MTEKIKARIVELEAENKRREDETQKMAQQREQILIGMQQNKEAHDFCRGQVDSLRKLLEEQEGNLNAPQTMQKLEVANTTNESK